MDMLPRKRAIIEMELSDDEISTKRPLVQEDDRFYFRFGEH